jgi:uncharacterized membrane protein
MLWLFFAVSTALTESLKDICGKYGLRQVDEYIVAASMSTFGALFLSPILLIIERPLLGPHFFLYLFAAAGLYTASIVLYFKALRLSDISITVPLVMYSPVFLLFTSPVMLGEYPSNVGILGVILIVFGSYLLNISASSQGIFAPFRALLDHAGPRVMLGVAFIWSITANIDKAGLAQASPMFWIVSHLMVCAVFSSVYVMIVRRRLLLLPAEAAPRLILIGLAQAVHAICYISTLSLGLVVYALSMKRTSVLISVVMGRVLFDEGSIRERFIGAAVMLVGVIVVVLSNV